MKAMTHRTTFALDEVTAARLGRLAGAWRVSQAEVVRRAVALAEEKAKAEGDAAGALRALHESGRALIREDAEEYLAAVAANRRAWRDDG
jgi:Arc/MetJ-type ribon-helix-helix transcriptional regulator